MGEIKYSEVPKMNEEILTIKVKLQGDTLRKFLELKEKLGILNNTDVVRTLIHRCYRREIEGDRR